MGSTPTVRSIMTILVSPTEPPAIAALGDTSSVPEQYGCDILVPGHGILVGVQRKAFPADFMASLADGRFTRFVAQMSAADLAILVIEGSPRWTTDGTLISDYHAVTKSQIWGIQFSLLLKGIGTVWTANMGETAQFVVSLEAWANKPTHNSLDRRPKPKGEWGGVRDREWQKFLLQSFPGIGPTQAERIIDAFGQVPLQWSATTDELASVPGMGPVRVRRLFDSLGKEEPDG